MKHVVQFSGGKDSTCMLLMMLEKGMQVDDIVFCDTGMEFPQMYEHIQQVEKLIGEKYKKHITVLNAPHTYEYYMFDHVPCRRKNVLHDKIGYSWPGPRQRWCTRAFKIQPTDRYFRGQKILKYIGIAYDEPKRHTIKPDDVMHPLFDWKITEKMALSFCYEHGFTWGGALQQV